MAGILTASYLGIAVLGFFFGYFFPPVVLLFFFWFNFLALVVVLAAWNKADRGLTTSIIAASIVFWLSAAWQQRFGLDALPAQQLPISTPTNIWREGPAPAELQDRWCLTAGDSDFL